jgi:hypothetical protein
MKAKTRNQVRVNLLSRKLHALSRETRKWADDNLFKHYYYRTLKKNTCMECGHEWKVMDRIPLDKLLEETCPRCHSRLEYLPNRKRTTRAISFFYTASVLEEYQVLRYFQAQRFCKVGLREKLVVNEVCQHWIRKDGRREVRALLYNPSGYFMQLSSRNMDMEIRSNKDNYFFEGRQAPGAKFLKEIRRNGYRGKLHGLRAPFFFQLILSSPHAETLLKAKQYKLLNSMGDWYGETRVAENWPSLRICLRNSYMVKDPVMWFDHMRMLKDQGADMLNSRYVCPADLKGEHDKLVRRRQAAEARKEAEQRKREIEKYNKVFRKQKARYFGIEFTDGEINVRVLDDVKDYFIEGKELHHCVFTSSYFNKKDTLILSARKGDERIATVEISLKEWKVLQCRGRNNSVPPYYKDIVRLVTGNIEVFKRRVRMHEAA